ncbi:MAG: hypothetical protein LUO86_07650 [Methanomicrobiales archaeon]|jgi:hypothetical protein|nr:hypothetical protein [Methanomicrobiales archaeon]
MEMVAENTEIAHADARSDSKSGDPPRWLRWLLLPSIIIVAISFSRVTTVFIVAVVLAISIELILSRFRSRRVMYACSLAVLLFAAVFTVGIVGHTKSVPSTVTGLLVQGGDFGVMLTGEEGTGGDMIALVRKGDFQRILSGREGLGESGNEYVVELTYRTQSILGVSALQPVVDAIDSKLVVSDYRQYLRGGITGRVMFPITLVLGVLPLACLVCWDRKNLFGRRIPR